MHGMRSLQVTIVIVNAYILAEPNRNQSTYSVATTSFSNIENVMVEMTKQDDLGLACIGPLPCSR